MREHWKDIAGYEGYYQVSNLGRVRSLDRDIVPHGKNSALMVERGRSMKGVRANTAKLTDAKVRAIRRRVAKGAKYVHLAAEYGVSDIAIRLAALGRTWRHV